MQPYKYIYGPVPSRRLGRSLGVDIIPFKTCSYDCVYCQLGHTTVHTTERGSWVSCSDVLSELERFLRTDKPDVISFAGSGEPTLNEELGDMIHGIKQMTDVPVAVFTNASLLWMPDVIEDLALADIVSPSMDAALPATAERINRPAGNMPLDVILEGLTRFCNVYRGRIWLEILLAQGLNDSEEDIAALAAQAAKLRHIERIQLNSVCRPPADSSVKPLTMARLEEIRSRMPGRCEIIASFPEKHTESGRTVTEEDVRDLIERHPSTVDGTAAGLGISSGLSARLIASLKEKGVLREEERGDGTYYFLAEQRHD